MPRSPVARIFIYGVGIDLLFSSLVASRSLVTMNFSDAVFLGPRSIEATVLTSLGILCAGLVVAFLFVDWLLAPIIERISLLALDRRVEIPGRGLSFRQRLVGLALLLALAPTLYLA